MCVSWTRFEPDFDMSPQPSLQSLLQGTKCLLIIIKYEIHFKLQI